MLGTSILPGRWGKKVSRGEVLRVEEASQSIIRRQEKGHQVLGCFGVSKMFNCPKIPAFLIRGHLYAFIPVTCSGLKNVVPFSSKLNSST